MYLLSSPVLRSLQDKYRFEIRRNIGNVDTVNNLWNENPLDVSGEEAIYFYCIAC